MPEEEKKKHNPGILDWILDFFLKPILDAFPGLVDHFKELVSKADVVAPQNLVKARIAETGKIYAGLFTAASPLTPDEANKRAATWELEADLAYMAVANTLIACEAASFGQVDMTLMSLLDIPTLRVWLGTAERIAQARDEASLLIPLRRHFLSRHTPMLPPYQDMISTYVREGYLPEKWVEIPEEFTAFMKELGYSEDWSKRLWGQHWVLPGVTLLYEMFHKKIIDYKTMVQMLKYHDFEPVWRDRLIANAWALIPRVDLRRGYAWGMISGDQLQDRYERLGFAAADATIMTGIAKRYGLTTYYSRLLTVAAATFRKGQLSGPDFQNIMEVCGLPREAQDLLLDAETMARAAAVTQPGEEPRTLSAAQICTAYAKGLLSLSAAKIRLLDLGFLEGDADLLLALAAPKPASEAPATEIVSAASLLYRNGWMSSEEFTTWLRKANLTLEEIAVVKDAQDLRYWLDYASDLLALWKQMYAKDVITEDEFYTNLLTWGCQPERAWPIVSLETTRKIPKPRAAG